MSANAGLCRGTLAAGLGFTCAVESILGSDGTGTFDEAFLAELEPTVQGRATKRRRSQRGAATEPRPEQQAAPRRRRRKRPRTTVTSSPEPLLVTCEAYKLNASLLELVVDGLGDADDDTEMGLSSCGELDDSEETLAEAREFALSTLHGAVSEPAGSAALASRIEAEVLRHVTAEAGGFDSSRYARFVASVCSVLRVDCVRKFVLSEDIAVSVLVDSTISSSSLSARKEDWEHACSQISFASPPS